MTRRWRLFPKYALLIIALVTAMVLASGAVGIYFSHRENQDHLVALQDEKAQGAANRIEQYVQGIEHQLSWTALPRIDSGGDALEVRRIEYLKLLRQAPAITEVAWIDPGGREQLRVSRLAMDTRDSGADLSQEPKFLQAGAGKAFFGPVYFRKGTEPYLTIARPAGSGGGVTAAEVNLKFVWEVVSRIRIGEKGLAYVVEAGGTLIAHPDISLVLKKTDLRALPQVAALAANDGRAPDGARNLQGEPVLSAFARIPTLGWTVFVESPRAEAYAPLYATLQRMGLVLVAALLVSAAASYLLARALVRPLRALQEGAAQIGAGDLDRHIEVRTGDELEGLAEQFNQMGAALRASYAGLERKVEERTAELSQALERQTATAQILRVISGSPTSVQPVLDAVAERSGLLCHAEGSRVWLAVNGELRAMTSYGPAYGNPQAWYPSLPLRATSPAGRAFLERRAVQVEDVKALIDTEYPDVRELQARHGFRTVLAVPLLREGEAVGIIGLLRNEVRPFTPTEISLVQTFADQAVIAIENVRLFSETREALEQQTASAEILQVISGSVADTKPVFDKILESCSKLFDTTTQAIVLVGDDGQLHLAGQGGQASGRLQGMYPRPLAGSVSELAMRERRVLHYRDALSGEDVHPVFREAAQHVGLGPYSVAVAPMLWEDRGIGALFVVRMPPSGFSDKELALLKTFADQASIAIQNARLFNETKEALEQQTATAEVLQVISSSPTDVQPVFDAICERAMTLCDAHIGGVARFDGELVHLVAFHGTSPEATAAMLAAFPMPPGRGAITARAIVERAPVQIADVLADPDYALKDATRLAGYRSNLAVPMLREGQVVGSIGVCRREPGTFPDKQVKLLETFADQAVIAIENVRLFNETREALERQTATAEILRVISGSPTSTEPVFDAILASGARLCEADMGLVLRYEGGIFQTVATLVPDPAFDAFLRQPIKAGPGTGLGRVASTKAPVHIPDLVDDDAYRAGDPLRLRSVELGGVRTWLGVPMLREGELIGALAIYRKEVRPFARHQIDVLSMFADQAVIAIENVRLFNETKEALERQTATAEILRVISGSITDTQPVFDAIVRSCHRLFSDARVALIQPEGNELVSRARAGREAPHGANQMLRWPIDRASAAACCILDSRMISVADLDTAAETYPRIRQLGLAMGFGSGLFVPLLRDAKAIGCLSILRVQKGEFEAKEVSLAQTFADQAVIAIENVRLFNETKEALERQTATAEILKVISESPTDVQPVFDVIAGRAAPLTGADYGWVFRFDGELIHIVSSFGVSAAGLEATRQAYPMSPSGGSATARAVREAAVINYADVLTEKDAHDKVKAIRRQSGYRSVLAVPMRRDDRIVGVITVAGAAVGQFGDKEIDLLQTFARQAVIAIENARLFNETKEALEQQTATAEILEVISNSVSDTQPAFDKIMDSCQRLFGTSEIGIRLVGDDGQLHLGSHRGSALETLRKQLPRPLDQTAAGLAIREQRVLHYPDVLGGADVPELLRRVAHEADNFSIIMAPMVWKERGIGTINVVRRPPAAFSEKEMSLLKTFADQAVIAIQNARLFNETKNALERQTATAEILRVISGSPTDVHPVLVAVAERAALLCDAVHSSVLLVDGEMLRQMAVWAREPGVAGPVEGRGVPILRSLVNGRAFIERRTVHVEDIEPLLDTEYPDARANFERIGFHAMLAVPMLREGQAIGTIFIWRHEARRFSSEQIALVETFASQAVIAIENVRLFNETKEALERQTATAEVLQVISSSVADAQPVFDKIMDSCERLFSTTGLGIYLVNESGMVDLAGFRGDPHHWALAGGFPRPLGEPMTNLLRERRVVHFADALADTDVWPTLRRNAQITGNFSIAFAPMLWEGRGVGMIQIGRDPPNPFTEKELALLKTFADQAGISIQNSRLFNEIQSKSRELEQANKHKSEFLANMSHELRTPLNAIIGFSEVLSEQMFGDVNDKQREYLLDIHSSGHHLLSLINDILDLSKIEAGRMELELTSFNLPMLLDNTTTLVRERALRQGLTLILDVAPELGDWVADARKLKQVVINLLSNAVKFTPAGGRITLRARALEHAVEIAVVDTGVGIAPDQQALVFEEFRQAGGDYLRKAEGTGLGLALAKRFVELHGGTMRVESEPGRGSTFAFILPERELEAAR